MRHRAALVAGSLALALASLVPAGAGQGGPAADGWRTFEAAWSAAGRRQAVAIEGGEAARIYEFSGALVIKKGEGLGRGFEAEAIAFDDGEGVSAGRCVWTDEHGDRIFSRLRGESLAKGRRLVGTITGGTGRYAGLEGEYSFSWQYVLAVEDGTIQGRTEHLQGRVRRKGATP
jgi:hypothetical protein